MHAQAFLEDRCPAELLNIIFKDPSAVDLTYLGCLCRRMMEICLPIAVDRCNVDTRGDKLFCAGAVAKELAQDLTVVYAQPNRRSSESGFSALAALRLLNTDRDLAEVTFLFKYEDLEADVKYASRMLEYANSAHAVAITGYYEMSPALPVLPRLFQSLAALEPRWLFLDPLELDLVENRSWDGYVARAAVFEEAMSRVPPLSTLTRVHLVATCQGLMKTSTSFLNWLVNSLSHSNIDTFFFEDCNFTQSILFPMLNMPGVRHVVLSCNTLSPQMLHLFLSRHACLTKLAVRSPIHLSLEKVDFSDISLLQLRELSGSPDVIALLINYALVDSSKLVSVELVIPNGEEDNDPAALPFSFRRALAAVSSRPRAKRIYVTYLRLTEEAPEELLGWFGNLMEMKDAPVLSTVDTLRYQPLILEDTIMTSMALFIAFTMPRLSVYEVAGLSEMIDFDAYEEAEGAARHMAHLSGAKLRRVSVYQRLCWTADEISEEQERKKKNKGGLVA